MKNLLKIEEIALLGLSIFLFNQTAFTWWWFPALILLPDLSMLGYVSGPRTGALLYNFFHHKALAIVVLCLGGYLSNEWLTLTGIILLGHSSLDRALGYGLKYKDDFKHTSLGWIGKDTSPAN